MTGFQYLQEVSAHFVCREIPDAARESQHAALLEKEHLVSFSTLGLIL